jgi:glutathione S-transferase
MVFKVYANQNSELTKVLVTAKYSGINVEVAPGEVTPELLAKNPTGKIPTLETSEGVIFESNAIVRYRMHY